MCPNKSWFYTCSLTCVLLCGFTVSPKLDTLWISYVKPYFFFALKFHSGHQMHRVFLQGHPNVVTPRWKADQSPSLGAAG